jgi:hypothetical protein
MLLKILCSVAGENPAKKEERCILARDGERNMYEDLAFWLGNQLTNLNGH